MNNRVKNAILQAGESNHSFYMYDRQGITAAAQRLKNAFPDVDFLYSVKCNPHEKILDNLFSEGFGADAASSGEVALCRAAGLAKEKIYYSAPGKTAEDIENTIDRCVIIADSLNEIEKINAAALKKNKTVEIGIRINPDFGFVTYTGIPSKFGIDEQQAKEFIKNNNCRNVRITGIHVHLRSQELNIDAIESYYKKMLKLSGEFSALLGKLDYVNMGSGIGVRYAAEDTAPDVDKLGDKIKHEFEKFRAANKGTKIIIETGRYVVCNSGWYVTKVTDKKISHGKTYVLLHNTLNGFIRPSLARLVMKYSSGKNLRGSEPLFTGKNSFEFIPLTDRGRQQAVCLVGNLCTATDIIAEDITMPMLNEGDLIAVTNAGAYAAVLSPMQFSSQTPPAQLYLTKDGNII